MALDLTQLNAELETYIAQRSRDIFKRIYEPVFTEQQMRPIAGVQDQWQAASSEISEVLQPYQEDWTPKGDVSFDGNIIRARKIKIDMELIPDQVEQTWLGFLAQEGVDRQQWPITRYVIEEMLLPKIREELELIVIGNGVYSAPTPGTPGAAVDAVDGVKKIITDGIASGNINEVVTGVITEGNIIDKLKEFLDAIPTSYHIASQTVLLARTLVNWYWWDMKNTYQTEPSGSLEGGFSFPGTNLKLLGLPSMEGSQRMFLTPKNNFIRVFDNVEYVGNIEIQKEKRKLIMLVDFKRGYGFGYDVNVYANDQA